MPPPRLSSTRLQRNKPLPVLPNVYCETSFTFTAGFTTPPVQGRASTLILVACTAWADDHIASSATAAVAAVRHAGIHLMWDRRTPQTWSRTLKTQDRNVPDRKVHDQYCHSRPCIFCPLISLLVLRFPVQQFQSNLIKFFPAFPVQHFPIPHVPFPHFQRPLP